jgi:hypothetical protein
MEIDGLKLVQTCRACPEQYDVLDEDHNVVGYLRLRHGMFRVDYPNCGGETIYTAFPKGDGAFYDSKERNYYLGMAVKAIKERLNFR